MQETREQILSALAEEPQTGPALASRLDISRAAVWKHIEALRDSGFVIVSETDGYRLESVPEFGASAIEFGLDAPFQLEYHDSIPSTNARARELAIDGESDVVVVADSQTGGRGRLNREWVSPSGGIWCSLLVRPDVPVAHAPVFTLAAAVTTAEALQTIGIDAQIKWPNDVLVDGQKIAGILSEMEGEADRLSWVVVGIGLNANVERDTLPEGSTSIRDERGDIERALLTRTLLETFHELRTNTERILPRWRKHAATLGQEVRVETPTDVVRGKAIAIEFPGKLRVDTGDGVETVTTGDCEHLRTTR